MPANKINILCTRPLDELLIQKAANQNIYIDTVSFIKTEIINTAKTVQQIQSFAEKRITAIFTSMNAVEAVKKQLSSKPDWAVFCIGGITKELVYNFFGEACVAGTAKNATVLAEKIKLHKNNKEVIFFCGDHRLDELPEMLAEADIKVRELIVYETIETPQFVDKNYHGVVFFSPSAVHSFFSANTIATNAILFSIGKTTTANIKSYCINKIITSEWPGKEQMIEQVIHYFETVKDVQ